MKVTRCTIFKTCLLNLSSIIQIFRTTLGNKFNIIKKYRIASYDSPFLGNAVTFVQKGSLLPLALAAVTHSSCSEVIRSASGTLNLSSRVVNVTFGRKLSSRHDKCSRYCKNKNKISIDGHLYHQFRDNYIKIGKVN